MTTSRQLVRSLAIVTIVALSGCASIISGRRADVSLESYPTKAHVVVHDKHGLEVASVDTPAVVSLKRKDRLIWPAHYTATFSAPGYAPSEVPIQPTLNPWIAGNLLAGGVIGLAVDNVTGAAWKPKQDKLVAQMTPAGPGPIPGPQIAAAPPLPTATAAAPYPVTQTAQQSPSPVEYTAQNPVSAASPPTRMY